MMQRQYGFVWFSDKHDSVKEILWFGLQSVSYNVCFNRLLFVAMVINMWLKLWSRWWSFFLKEMWPQKLESNSIFWLPS